MCWNISLLPEITKKVSVRKFLRTGRPLLTDTIRDSHILSRFGRIITRCVFERVSAIVEFGRMVHPFHRLSKPEVIVEIAELERGSLASFNRGSCSDFVTRSNSFLMWDRQVLTEG